MNNNLFQNDSITGNSKLGFEFCGVFKYDEEVLISKLKDITNRNISYSNIEYKLLEPTDMDAVLIKDGKSYIVKTPMYSYFEAIYILPKLIEFLGELKDFNNTYLYVKIGFNEDYLDLNQLNLMKFLLSFNEDFILSKLSDITKNGSIEKITNIKPSNIEECSELVQKHVENLKYIDDEEDVYALNFSSLSIGYIKFKYIRDINYRNKWENILKCINHTIIILSNSCKYNIFDDSDNAKIEKLNNDFNSYATAFGCYELFHEKYKSIKLTIDLSNDKSLIDMIFPSIKDKLFNLVVCNDLKTATINYDSDISKLQLKDVELKKCYHINDVDIVDGEIENCCFKNCDLYDTKITSSKIIKCNLFGYANCKDSKFKDCFISRNIKLTDCNVYGQLGKMAGVMKGGSLKNTTVLVDMAEIDDNVEKDNVNEMR